MWIWVSSSLYKNNNKWKVEKDMQRGDGITVPLYCGPWQV